MENKENQAIYQKLKRLYNAAKFKNKKDENAFLGLLRIYMGRNSGTGTVNEDLTSMESRKIAGDSFFDNTYRDSEIGQEAQTRIAQLNESYVQHFNEFKQRRIDTRKTRIGKAIQNSELNKTYNTKVADRILPLALAYSGRNQNGNKKFKTVEQRYEQADKVLMQLGGKLSQVEKKAARDLYNMFKAQDNKEYERTKDNRTRQLDARRDALRIQHANTINHSLESLVTKDVKLETALERTVIPEKKNSGIMGYISNAIKKPWGKVAAAGLGLVTAGLIVYGASQIRGCNGKQPTKPIAIIAGIASETKTEEKELRFTPDPFKPVPEIKEALAETGKGKAPERTRCIDWEKSKLEQEIQSYQLKDGTFKAKLGKNLAEAMRKDSSIILRLISNNKLSEEAKHLGITYLIYETNKLRENNEIEIKGVMPQTGVSFGIIKKAEGNCGDYLASMKVGPAKEYKTKAAAPTVITKETQKPGKAGIREKTKATPTIKPEMKEKKHFVPPPSEAITTKPGIEEVDKTGISSVRKYDMTYRKAWGLRGSYDWMQNYQKKDVENMYEELKQAFKDNQPEYIFINRTMGTEKGVPKVVVEFSNKGEESRLEKLLDAHKDMNNPSKKVTILNFGEREPGFGKKEKLGYETMVPLTGLTPGEAAKLASTKILEKIHEMRTQGHFDTYSFKRDVRSLDKNINPGIKAYLFVTKGTKKAIGAVFAEENTEVKLVSEDDKLDNDNIQIGESLEQKLGPNQGKGGAAGPGAGGGVGDGGPGGK